MNATYHPLILLSFSLLTALFRRVSCLWVSCFARVSSLLSSFIVYISQRFNPLSCSDFAERFFTYCHLAFFPLNIIISGLSILPPAFLRTSRSFSISLASIYIRSFLSFGRLSGLLLYICPHFGVFVSF